MDTLPQKYLHGLMDRTYNCSNTSKLNSKCVYKGKWQKKCLIYEVKCKLCGVIYMGEKHIKNSRI